MLAKRIIPCMDVDQGRVVKGVNFVDLVDAGDPLENARFYDQEKADEIIFLDITASSDNRNILFDMARKVAEKIYTPFMIGGGLRSVEDVRRMVQAGADRISLNTAVVENPSLISDCARVFGSQCIVVAIDAKKNQQGSYDVYIRGGRKKTKLDVIQWAKRVEELGAGEILLTSMDQDGTRRGYEIELTRQMVASVRIPVIASGGVGTKEHIFEGFSLAGASAVLAASIFHFREISIYELRKYLKEKGISVRD